MEHMHYDAWLSLFEYLSATDLFRLAIVFPFLLNHVLNYLKNDCKYLEIKSLTVECNEDLFRHLHHLRVNDKCQHLPTVQSIPKKTFQLPINLKILNISHQRLYNYLDLSTLKQLQILDASHCLIRKLDVTNNIALTQLRCGNNRLESLDLSKNTALLELECPEIQKLLCPEMVLDLSTLKQLQKLDVRECGLDNLDVTHNVALTHLRCGKNRLESLDLSRNTALLELECPNMRTTMVLNVKNCRALESIDCHCTYIHGLDVSGHLNLKSLRCRVCNLTSLRLPGSLLTLDCDGNDIKVLDIKPPLKELRCSTNELEILNLHENDHLESVTCTSNRLRTLDVSRCKNLKTLDVCRNQLSSLDVTHNGALEKLKCNLNQIVRRIDTSKNPELRRLEIIYNLFDPHVADYSRNLKLKILYVRGCNLMEDLDMSKHMDLVYLHCDANSNLKRLIVPGNATCVNTKMHQRSRFSFITVKTFKCNRKLDRQLNIIANTRLTFL